jgi:hypothetical protein
MCPVKTLSEYILEQEMRYGDSFSTDGRRCEVMTERSTLGFGMERKGVLNVTLGQAGC